MDYKEKYEMALERAKSLYNSIFVNNDILEQLFPELKETEYEKIRKELLEHCKKQAEIYKTLQKGKEYGRRQSWINWLEKQGKPVQNEIKEEDIKKQLISYFRAESRDAPHRKEIHDKWISWIEKQGEKPLGKSALEVINEKPVDNVNRVEPKFKIGNWIIDRQGFLYKVARVTYDDIWHTYVYDTVNGLRFYDNTLYIRLWTLQDAKDGDVLSVDNRPFIYNGELDTFIVGGHCGITNDGKFKNFKKSKGYGSDGFTHFDNDIHPATKNQRKFLFKKMREAGYKWDAKKKELITIKENNI